MKISLKFLMFLSLFIVGTIQGFAKDNVQGIIIQLSSGEKVECMLSDNPKMVFDGTTVTITAANLNLKVTPSEIKKVMMGTVDDTSGIDDAKLNSSVFELNEDYIRLSGFTSCEEIKVYSASGVLYGAYRTSTDGNLILPMSSLPTGISIIKSNKQSIKISK